MRKIKEIITTLKTPGSNGLKGMEISTCLSGDGALALDTEAWNGDEVSLVSDIEKKGYKAVVLSHINAAMEKALRNSPIIPLKVSDRFFKKAFNGIKERTNELLRIDMRLQEVQLVEMMVKEKFIIDPIERACILNGYDKAELIPTENNTSNHSSLIIG